MSPVDTTRTPDLCVIGAGPAGVAAALTGVALGASVVLVERAAFGGEHVASQAPLEALRAAATAAQGRRKGAPGLAPSQSSLDWPSIGAAAAELAARAAPEFSAERLRAAGVEVVIGQARFAGPRELWAGPARIAARRFVLATGAAPVRPTGPGMDLARGLAPAELLALPAPPEAPLIIGGGAEALEIAQCLARLGARAVVLSRGPLLGDFAAESVAIVRRGLLAEGVDIIEGAELADLTPFGPERAVRVTLADGRRIEASHVIFAAGRRPSPEGLGLEAARVETSARGIVARRDLRTSNPRVYAAGSALDAMLCDRGFAERTGRLAARRALLPLPADARFALAARVVRTDPQVVAIGQAQPGPGMRALRAPWGGDARARAGEAEEGHVTLVADASGKLLGATLVGRDAIEAAGVVTLALTEGYDAARLAAAPLPSPSLAEAVARAAAADLPRLARSPAVGRLMRLGRWWLK